MSMREKKPPALRHHKPSGLAVITIDGHDRYLGRYGSPESHAEYARVLAEWEARVREPSTTTPSGSTPDFTVAEMLAAYLRFADGYYTKNGKPTTEPGSCLASFRELRRIYGHTLARDFGPLALKAVRGLMIEAKLCRNECNKRVGRIVRAFKWAVENELIPASAHHGLKAVAGLRRGRCAARESKPIRPVPDAFVDAIRPHVARQVWAMIELQRLTGMRPGEVCQMRTCDVDTSGRIWLYVPESHKTEHHGKERRIYIGPRAQVILRPWLRIDLTAALFSPAEAMAERKARRRADRKAPIQPSHREGAKRNRKRNPARKPGDRYTPKAFHHAIRYACQAAHVSLWHPNQLRHNAGTRLRKEFGLDAARAILGHSSPIVTEIYAELDGEKAANVMGQVG